jgi:hypothetical protein
VCVLQNCHVVILCQVNEYIKMLHIFPVPTPTLPHEISISNLTFYYCLYVCSSLATYKYCWWHGIKQYKGVTASTVMMFKPAYITMCEHHFHSLWYVIKWKVCTTISSHRQLAIVTVIRHVFLWMFWIDHTRFLMQIIFMTTSQFIRWGRKSPDMGA